MCMACVLKAILWSNERTKEEAWGRGKENRNGKDVIFSDASEGKAKKGAPEVKKFGVRLKRMGRNVRHFRPGFGLSTQGICKLSWKLKLLL